MKHLFGSLAVFFFALMLIGCSGDEGNKDHPLLTPVFVNRFQCLTNGELMKADSLNMYASYHEGIMQLVGWDNVSDGGKTVYLIITDPSTDKEYDLTELPDNMASYIRTYNWSLYPSCHYELENTLEGRLKISEMDTIKQTISGTFGFSSYNPEGCDESLNITEGKFEMKYVDTRFPDR